MTYKKERGMGMELKIPENFFVGAAMSGPQTEGAYKTGGRLEVSGIPGQIFQFLISTIKWEAM